MSEPSGRPRVGPAASSATSSRYPSGKRPHPSRQSHSFVARAAKSIAEAAAAASSYPDKNTLTAPKAPKLTHHATAHAPCPIFTAQ
jgi:hypothetical protein